MYAVLKSDLQWCLNLKSQSPFHALLDIGNAKLLDLLMEFCAVVVM